jgi:hypothetical protein
MRQICTHAEDPHNNAAANPDAAGVRVDLQNCRGRVAEHQRWMQRCFVLLCSVVVLRLIGGMTTVAGVEAAWVYPLAAWACWLVSLMAYELSRCVWR